MLQKIHKICLDDRCSLSDKKGEKQIYRKHKIMLSVIILKCLESQNNFEDLIIRICFMVLRCN